MVASWDPERRYHPTVCCLTPLCLAPVTQLDPHSCDWDTILRFATIDGPPRHQLGQLLRGRWASVMLSDSLGNHSWVATSDTTVRFQPQIDRIGIPMTEFILDWEIET